MAISADQSKLLAQMRAHNRRAVARSINTVLPTCSYSTTPRTVNYSRDTWVICDIYEAGYQVS